MLELPAVSPPSFPPGGFLNQVMNIMNTATQGWVPTVMVYAQRLFADLAALEIAWSALEFILTRSQAGWEGFVIASAKKLLQLSIFFWIVENANTIFWTIYGFFQSVGGSITGSPNLSPGGVLIDGMNFASLIENGVSTLGLLTHPYAALVLAVSTILIVIAFVIAAGQLMVTIAEAYIASSAGILLLGFAGSRWTATFADKYFSYAFGVGIKLLMSFVVIGLGQNLILQMNQALAAPGFFSISNFGQLLGNISMLLALSLIFAFMAWYIPQLASSLASGSVGMTLGAFAATAGSLGASLWTAGKIGPAAVLKGVETIREATAAGGTPLKTPSSISSLAPSAVSPPSSGGNMAKTTFSQGSPGGSGMPSSGTPDAGPSGGNSPPAPSGSTVKGSGEGPVKNPTFSNPGNPAQSGTLQEGTGTGVSGTNPLKGLPSDSAHVQADGPKFGHHTGGAE